MNVVYYTSDFFSEMCGVAIESLCNNNRETDVIDVYVVEDHVSDTNKSRLKAITDKYNRNLHFIKMPSQQEIFPDINVNLGRTYARMILTQLLPDNVDRVLSLDSDTLVLDSVDEMYNIDFEGKAICGVYDCLGKAMQQKVLKKGSNMHYCNAGMFLINLKKWRELHVEKLFVNAIHQSVAGKTILYFLEQDIMNIIFEKDLKLLHPRYNLLTSIYLFSYKELMKLKKPLIYYSEKEVNDAKDRPAIVHATTCFYVKTRMWVENSDHPYHKMYLQYRENTPFKDLPQIRDSRKWSKKLYGAFWHIMPRKMAIWLASLLIEVIRPYYAMLSKKFSLQTIANQSATVVLYGILLGGGPILHSFYTHITTNFKERRAA